MNNKAVIPIVAAAVLLVACTIAQGLLTERWMRLPEHAQVQSFVNRLNAKPGLPMTIGDWVGEDQEMDPRERDVAGIRGYISRTYTNTQTDERVSMMLVCGGFMHIAKHTPEMCYPAQGYTQEEATATYGVATSSDAAADFKTTIFKKENDHGLERIRVFWSWNYAGNWVAPASARWSLRGRPALYKLYLISALPGREMQLADRSPCVKFAREALPQLAPLLFPPGLEDKPSVATAQASP